MTDQFQKKKYVEIAFAVLVIILVAFTYVHFTRIAAAPKTSESQVARKEIPLSIAGVTLTAFVSDTDAARTQGLSDTPSLPTGTAMLFVFDTPGQYSFWMKDMN